MVNKSGSLLAVWIALMCSAALACGPATATVSLLNMPAGGGGYDRHAVEDHVNVQLPTAEYLPNTKTTFSCVDARSDSAILGTPGGDFAEFLGAATIFFRATNQQPDMESVRSLFRAFMASQITPSRPFYYHTDETRIKVAFRAISAQVGRDITVLPLTAPPANELPIWLEELSKSNVQGCGHLRLMIANFTQYGLTSDELPRLMLKVFFDEFWRASTQEQEKFQLVIKLGSLAGQAVGAVSVTGTCKGYTPALRPNTLGSSIFVYSGEAVNDFRKEVLATFFSRQGAVSADLMYDNMTALLNTQLGATLTLLSPANSVGLYSIEVDTAGAPPGLPSNASCQDNDDLLTCEKLVSKDKRMCDRVLADGTYVRNMCESACNCCNLGTECACNDNRAIREKAQAFGIYFVRSCEEALRYTSCDHWYIGSLIRTLCPCSCAQYVV